MRKHLKIDFFKLFLIAVILLSLYITIEPVWDNDLWWHVQTGKYVIENKTVPKTDVFSFYGIENNFKWIAHEWLSDVVLYVFYSIGWYQGLIIYPVLLLFLTLIVLYATIKDKIKDNYLLGFLCLFSTGLILALFSSTRPHMFSFFLFALTMYILKLFKEDENNKLIWLLPMLSILWVNLHGGSSALLFVMIFFMIIFNSLNFKIGRLESIKLPNKKLKALFIVLGVSVVTALINPYGYKMLLYPFENMADNLMLSSIVEWHSPNFHTPEGLVVFIILSIPIVITLVSNKKLSLYELALMGAFALLSLKSIRQITYFAVATLPISLYHMPKFNFAKARETKINYYANLTVVCFIVLLFAFNLFSTFKEPVNIEQYPHEAISAIEEYKPKRMLNHYNWGGFLIYNLYEKDIHHFIDGRADIFSPTIMEDYSKIHLMSENWEDSFEKFDFDSVLFPTNSLLIKYLINTGEWEVEYQDGFSTFLVKK